MCKSWSHSQATELKFSTMLNRRSVCGQNAPFFDWTQVVKSQEINPF